MKEKKHYSDVSFFVPLAALTLVGVVSIRTTSQQTTVLHRDQTDEWKGWMQLVILVYHITGASKVRTCVASPVPARYIWTKHGWRVFS